MANLLIVTVTKVETQAVLDTFSGASNTEIKRQFIAGKTYFPLGAIAGTDIYMVVSEMGVIGPAAAILTIRNAIDAIKPAAVIMVGIAFGINPEKQNRGEILVSRQIMAYDLQKIKGKQVIPRGDRVMASKRLLDIFRSGDLDWQGPKVHFGLILSGEKLIASQSVRDRLLDLESEAIGGEMEGAGLYSAASDAGVDWILVKGICDWATEAKNSEYQKIAAENAARFTLHVLRQGGLRDAEQPPEVHPVPADDVSAVPLTTLKERAVSRAVDADLSWWSEEGAAWFEQLSENEAIDNIRIALINRGVVSVEVVNQALDIIVQEYRGDVSSHSGRPVIRHILAVAKTVVETGLDQESVAAALLHDVVEDAKLSQAQLEEAFGARIGSLVESVSRYENDKAQKSEASHQRYIIEKVIDTLRTDLSNLPAIFIKLAEKLDHLRYSAPHFPYDQRQDIAKEVMEGYAPLAERLGVWKLKAELEDLAFNIQKPDAYDQIAKQHKVKLQATETFMRQAARTLEARLNEAGIEAEVQTRKKHIYSTYEKMRRKGSRYHGALDLLGLRIIVETDALCFSAIRIVHSLWRPIAGEFDDYIANPKPNGYQSLHTTVISNEGYALEVQIRTRKMHEIAEFGMAAHWRYKDTGEENEQLNALFGGLRKYLETQSHSKDSSQFYSDFRGDELRDQIHVYYLPSGELVSLPEGSTPIDLVYETDEEKANWCIGSKVGDFEVPLSWILNTGDLVTILTSDEYLGPEREWFTFVKTSKAREKIRMYFQTSTRELNILNGETILASEIKVLGLPQQVTDAAVYYGYSCKEELLEEIGSCQKNARDVANELFRKPYREEILKYWAREAIRQAQAPIPDRVVVARCCRPELGERLVVGYDAATLKIHSEDCPSLAKRNRAEMIKLPRIGPEEVSLEGVIRIQAKDRFRLLNDITEILVDEAVNITDTIIQPEGLIKTIDVRVEIFYFTNLSNLLHRVSLIPSVERACVLEAEGDKVRKWKITRKIEAPDLRLEQLSYRPSTDRGKAETATKELALTAGEYYKNKLELRNALEKAFNYNEFALLCHDTEEKMMLEGENVLLRLNSFGDLPLPNLISEVVDYLDRRACLYYLIDAFQYVRPRFFANKVQHKNTQ